MFDLYGTKEYKVIDKISNKLSHYSTQDIYIKTFKYENDIDIFLKENKKELSKAYKYIKVCHVLDL